MREPWELAWMDYYEALGIEPDAPADDVHASFRALARIYHPDRHHDAADATRGEAERRFKIIGEAYTVLRDPARRQAYDEAHARARDGPAPVPAITVEPEALALTTLTGDVVIRSHLKLPPGLPHALVSADCDDADAELQSIDLRPCVHGADGMTDVAIGLRLHVLDARTLHLEYRVAAHVAAQTVRVRVIPAPFNWPGRVYRNFGARGSLVLAGIAGLLLGAYVSGETGMTIGYTGVALIGLGVLGYVVGFFSTPGWTRKLRPRLGWMPFVGLLIGAQVVIRLLQYFF